MERWDCDVRCGAASQALSRAPASTTSGPTSSSPTITSTTAATASTPCTRCAWPCRRRIPAIIITADRSPAIADAARELDCELLLKPVKPAELRALMLHLLARAAQPAVERLSLRAGRRGSKSKSIFEASITACVREATLSLRRISETCAFTVVSPTPRSKAICLLSSPWRSMCSTRTCCGVSVAMREARSDAPEAPAAAAADSPSAAPPSRTSRPPARARDRRRASTWRCSRRRRTASPRG